MKALIFLSFIFVKAFCYSQKVIEFEDHKLKNKIVPSFKARALNNKEINLEDLTGKIIFLDFWSLSCGACFKELPELNEIVNKYPTEKFVLISLMDNSKDELLKKFQIVGNGYRLKVPIFGNDKIDFQIIPNAKEIMKLFSDQIAFPQAFIIDQKRVLTFYQAGYAERRGIPGELTSKDMFIQEIDRLLNARE
jgi:thiol-disulfide isomerase/thioredoxin